MNKQELALQYFPDATSATAVRHLTRWIARCHPLVEALTGTGYQSRNRTFTWKQVTLIRQYLGEPSIIRKTKCFDFWERNVLFPKTKRSFFRTPTPLPCPFPLNFSLLIITKKFGNLAKNRYICIV